MKAKKILILGLAPLFLAGCGGQPKEEPHVHKYDHANPQWTWAEDNSSATLLLDCPGCDEDLTATANSTVKTEATPTCTEGSTRVLEVSAELDGETFTDEKEIEVSATGHEMEKHNAVAPSCTEPGSLEYWTCSHEEGVLFKDANGAEKFNSAEELVVEATGHHYQAATYSWNGNKCTATKVCAEGDDTITETVEGQFVQDTPATCETPQKGHYVATFTKEGFTQQQTATNSATGDDAKGHDWGEPTYTWTNNKCTAKRICKNNSNHVETETVTGSYVKDTDATCLTNEKGHREATFQNPAFAKQVTATNSVTIPDSSTGHDWGEPTYSWSGDACTATIVCKHDASHKQSEVAYGTYEKDSAATCTENEKGHYEVSFENAAFSAQQTAANSIVKQNTAIGHDMTYHEAVAGNCGKPGSKEYWTCSHEEGVLFKNAEGTETYEDEESLVIYPTGNHTFGTPTYTWNDDNTKVTAEVLCEVCEVPVREVVDVTSEVTLEPTTTAKGQTTYTAEFTNPLFETQTKTLTNIENIEEIIDGAFIHCGTPTEVLDEDKIDTADGFEKAYQYTGNGTRTYFENYFNLDKYEYVTFAAMPTTAGKYFEIYSPYTTGAGANSKTAYKLYRLERVENENDDYYKVLYKEAGGNWVQTKDLQLRWTDSFGRFTFKLGSGSDYLVSELRGKLRLDYVETDKVADSPLNSGVTSVANPTWGAKIALADVNPIMYSSMRFTMTNNTSSKGYYGFNVSASNKNLEAGQTVDVTITKKSNGLFNIAAYSYQKHEYNDYGDVELDAGSLKDCWLTANGDAGYGIDFGPLYGRLDPSYSEEDQIMKNVSFVGNNTNYSLEITDHSETEFEVAKGTTITFTVTPASGYEAVVTVNGEPLAGTDNVYTLVVNHNSEIAVSAKEAIADVLISRAGLNGGTYDSETGLTQVKGFYATPSGYTLASVNVNKYTKMYFDVKFDTASGYIKFGLNENVNGGGDKGFAADTLYTVTIETVDTNKVSVTIAKSVTGETIGSYTDVVYELPHGLLSGLSMNIYSGKGDDNIYVSELRGILNPEFTGNDVSVVAINPKTGTSEGTVDATHIFDGDTTYTDNTYGKHALAAYSLAGYNYAKLYAVTTASGKTCGVYAGGNTEYQFSNATALVELYRTGENAWTVVVTIYSATSGKKKIYTGVEGNDLSMISLHNHTGGAMAVSQLYVL